MKKGDIKFLQENLLSKEVLEEIRQIVLKNVIPAIKQYSTNGSIDVHIAIDLFPDEWHGVIEYKKTIVRQDTIGEGTI